MPPEFDLSIDWAFGGDDEARPVEALQSWAVDERPDLRGCGGWLLWVVRAHEDLIAGGVVVELARSGCYDDRRAAILPWATLERAEVATVGELLGRRILARPGARRSALEIMPALTIGPRPVLLGAAPAPAPLGGRALEGHSGIRLAEATGWDLSAILATFETRNLREFAGEPLGRAVDRLDLSGRVVVVVGRETARAIIDVAGPGLQAVTGAQWIRVIDHPSGKNPSWRRSAWRWAREVLVDAVVSCRRAGLVGDELELAAAVASAHRGEPDGWRRLADLGLAAHSARLGAAWRLTAGGWVRRWATGRAIVRPLDGVTELELDLADGRGGRIWEGARSGEAVAAVELQASMASRPWREVSAGGDSW